MRLIDADAMIADLLTVDPQYETMIEWCCTVVDAQPTIEPERKTGRWIYGEHDVAMCDGYWCDKCGFFVPWDYQHKSIDFIKDYHFCPSCGARKEVEHG